MNRADLLDKAKELITKERNGTYGEPDVSFGTVALLWGAFTDYTFTSKQVAIMLGLLKIARLKENPTHVDSMVDLAGYAACAIECTPQQQD